MRILLLTQLFQPEPNHLKGLDFARELVRRGHEVEVLTGFPNYPGGKVYPGYRIRPWMRETLDGIRVTRVFMYPSHDRSAIRRMAAYLSFALTASILGPFLIARPDVIHVYQGPSTLGGPASVFKAMFGTPFILDVQDLWPESVSSTAMLPLPGVESILGIWSKLIYHLAKKIVVLSEGYRNCLLRRGVPDDKIKVVYNWCDERSIPQDGKSGGEDPYGFRGKFNIVYSGNFGTVQALKNVLDAAVLVADSRPDIRFVLVGDGVEESRLKEIVARRGQHNVLFVPRQSPECLKAITASADVLLVHLKDDPLAQIGIPQKIQTALAAGKPVLLVVRGSAAELVCKAGAGLICRPGSPRELAEAGMKMAGLPEEQLRTMGKNGREFYTRNLAFPLGVGKMEAIFESAVRTDQGGIRR